MEAEPSAGAARQLDFHPAMGMRWEITRSTEETAGEVFESTHWYDAREPGPNVHVHPNSDDTFEVIDGTLEVCIDGEWRPVRAGEAVTVPAGAPHTFRNASDQNAKVKRIMRPAGRSEAFFRDMHRLIGEYPDEIRSVNPPNGVFKALAVVGRALRFKL